MAKARALDKRRKSIRNIRKITRTMELIATARFKKAMDRATAATSYTNQITRLVSDLAGAGLKVTHPLLEPRSETKSATLLVLTANRGLCGGYNGNVQRMAYARWQALQSEVSSTRLEISGKRGIAALKYRDVPADESFTHFEDKVTFEEVDALATRYLEAYVTGKLDRLEVVYTKFLSASRQVPVVETLLPLGSLGGEDAAAQEASTDSSYEFFPSAESILEELVPASFKVKLFKCFLDSAVSEQIARMVAMKAATENAGDLIRQLSRSYNRARQSQITGEIMEIIGGVEALNK
jgi:F-type H+-transporting ATPase subunit gamma